MANDKTKDTANEIIEGLSGETDEKERQALFERIASEVESPALQDEIIRRYSSMGSELLSDTLPQEVDPRVSKILKPLIGDVSGVRVHSGRVATEAAKAMDARAFAIGDQDIFIDQSEFSPGTTQGRALMAHELAHTRDAATGFALSSRGGGGASSDREAFAHAVEDQYVQAEADDDSIQMEEREPAVTSGTSKGGGADSVDKQELENRIWNILEKQQSRAAERFGR